MSQDSTIIIKTETEAQAREVVAFYLEHSIWYLEHMKDDTSRRGLQLLREAHGLFAVQASAGEALA